MTNIRFKPSLRWFCLLGLFVVLVVGCATDAVENGQSIVISPPNKTTNRTPAVTSGLSADDTNEGLQVEIFEGSGRLIASPAERGRPPTQGDKIFLNFYDAELSEIVQFILGEQLQLSYVIEPGVAGTVTIQTSNGFDEQETLQLLETLLSVNNAAMVREPAGTIRIVPMERAADITSLQALDHRGRTLPPGYQTRVIPLRYVAAEDIQTVLRPFMNERLIVHTDGRRNLIIAAGTSTDLSRFIQNIALFDVDWMAGMSFGIYPVNFAKPSAVISELEAIFARDNADDEGILRFISLERIGSILAVTPQKSYLKSVETWIERLDQSGAGEERRLFVYRVQNGRAADMAAMLGTLFSGEVASNPALGQPELAPGLQAVEVTSDGERAVQRSPATQSTDVSFSLGGSASVRVISDDINNALVVFANSREYQVLLEAVEQLDIPPMQVLIEASIIEVRLNDDLQYGVEWFFKNNFDIGAGKQGRGLLDLGGPGLGPFAPSFSYAIVDNLNQVRAVINTLASESKINVLSSPSLMVLGNQTATINVGDEVPVPTRQSVSNIDPDAPTVNEITYRDTGVILEVTPRINSGGLITIDVIQEVSDVGTTTSSGIDAPTFQQRKIASTVAVQSGSTVVLGGLIRDRTSVLESGIPILYKIPYLGKLFGSTSNESRRTELLVLITPRAVANSDEAYELTREFRAKLKGLKP